MPFPHMLHDHPAYAYDSMRSVSQWTPNPEDDVADEHVDTYDACKESPFVDTLVEGGVVLLIAGLINVTFWGIVHFGVGDNAALLGEVA